VNEALDDMIVAEAVNEDETQNVTIEAEEGRENVVETEVGIQNEEEETDQETGMGDMVVTRGMITRKIQRNAMSINTVASVHTRRDQAISVDFIMRTQGRMTTVGQRVEDQQTEEY
jgi:hypothetical protein